MTGPVGSLWERTAPPGPLCPPLEGERAVDVAIVGAGYTGLSTALHLAEAEPTLRIAVLEAEEPGFGASGRNNGQVIPTLTRPDPDDLIRRYGDQQGGRFVTLVRDSASLVFDLVRRHGIVCDAVQNGWVQPAHNQGRLKLSEARVRQWQSHGAPVELVDRPGLSSLLGTDAYVGGMLNPTGGHLNPLAYARGLASAARRLGVEVHGGSPGQDLSRDGRSWRLTAPDGALLAREVVIATAGYSGDLVPALRRAVVPVRSYQMATAPVSAQQRAAVIPGNHAVSDTRADLRFFRYDRDGRLVTGGALVLTLAARARLMRLVGRRLAETFPALGTPRFDFVWHGLFAATPDRFPRLFRLGQGLWSWIGCQGRGVALSTAMGRVLAEAVLRGDATDLPLPVEESAPISGHAVVARLSPLMLAWYRHLDRRA